MLAIAKRGHLPSPILAKGGMGGVALRRAGGMWAGRPSGRFLGESARPANKRKCPGCVNEQHHTWRRA